MFWNKKTRSIIVILIIVAAAYFLDVAALREFILSAGVWAPVIFIILKISTIVFAPLSGLALYPLVGVLFGFWTGMLYVIIGDFIGYSLAFWIGRFLGRGIVEKIISKNENSLLARIVDKISTTKGFFITCIIGFAASDVLSYAAGLTKLPYWKFVAILIPLSIIGTAVFVFFGSSLAFMSDGLQSEYALPILFAIVLVVGFYLLSRLLKK